uniref:NECAP PHear domain-containing protein n=1 Tax=Ditylum brightwellii TaxID=49249 RepID=A0A7S4R6D5_9STRA
MSVGAMSMGAEEEDVPKVVLEQTLLNVEEVFIYGIPPMKSSGGHRAEDWNLAKPLATCSLLVVRVDSTLELRILSSRPKPNAPKGATESYLFALCKIALAHPSQQHLQIPHWVEPVVDSSRYFVLRIVDTKRGREAHVGLGFRERTDATNFKFSLNEYENALKREWKAHEVMTSPLLGEEEKEGQQSTDTSDESVSSLSKLTLKEGEKIHIQLKANKGTRPAAKPAVTKSPIATKGGLLLKKPPSAANNTAGTTSPTPPPPTRVVDDTPPPPPASTSTDEGDEKESVASSTGAVATTAGEADFSMEDEEWGDFEGC